MKNIIISSMLSLMLLMQAGCAAPLAYAVGAAVFKMMEREQQEQQIILRNAEYHLKRGEHLDLLARHGIYPQKKIPEAKTNKVVVVKRDVSLDTENKDDIMQISMSDRATIQKTEVVLQYTNHQLQEICNKAIQTRQSLLTAQYDGNTEEVLTNNSNGGKKNVNE